MVSNRNKLTIGMKSARDKFDAGDFEGAITDYTEAINRRLADKTKFSLVDKNRLAEAYNSRGVAKSRLGRGGEANDDYDEAINLYSEVIETDPKNGKAWCYRGVAKVNRGRHEEAIADLDEAIEINPKNAAAWNNRGSARNALDRYQDALADYTEAIRLESKNALAWSNRSSAKAHLEDFDGAIKDVEEALRLSPNDPRFLNNRAAIKAEQAARKAVEGRLGTLEADTEEVKDQAKKYEEIEKTNRDRAYAIMTVLLVFIFVIVVFFAELESIDLAKPFSLLPLITIIIVMTSPLVWTIRLLLTEANSAKVMHAEYMHLAYVEGRMLVYFQDQHAKEVRADYIKTTMINSPADKLVALQNKASVPSPNPVQNVIETIRNKARGNSPS